MWRLAIHELRFFSKLSRRYYVRHKIDWPSLSKSWVQRVEIPFLRICTCQLPIDWVCTLKILPSRFQTVIYLNNLAQCPTMKLNKRSLPKPTTTTGWKLIPHRSKISMNWNPLHWDPIIKYFFKVFFRLTIFFSGTKKVCPRNNFCSVFNVLKSKKKIRSDPKFFEIFCF